MEEENNNFKIWVDEDKIVHLKMGEVVVNIQILEDAFKKYREIVKDFSTKPKVLIDISIVKYGMPASFRKKAAADLKDLFYDVGFEKIAMHGGNTLVRVMTLFFITAFRTISKLNNIQYFKTEEEALKWLKKS